MRAASWPCTWLIVDDNLERHTSSVLSREVSSGWERQRVGEVLCERQLRDLSMEGQRYAE